MGDLGYTYYPHNPVVDLRASASTESLHKVGVSSSDGDTELIIPEIKYEHGVSTVRISTLEKKQSSRNSGDFRIASSSIPEIEENVEQYGIILPTRVVESDEPYKEVPYTVPYEYSSFSRPPPEYAASSVHPLWTATPITSTPPRPPPPQIPPQTISPQTPPQTIPPQKKKPQIPPQPIPPQTIPPEIPPQTIPPQIPPQTIPPETIPLETIPSETTLPSVELRNGRKTDTEISTISSIESLKQPKASAIKKSGDESNDSGSARTRMTRSVSWNEDIVINASELGKAKAEKLQQEDHDYKPLEEDHARLRRSLEEIAGDDGVSIIPNGHISHTQASADDLLRVRAKQLGYYNKSTDDDASSDTDEKHRLLKYCTFTLLFLFLLALVTIIVLAVILAGNLRSDWKKEVSELKSVLSLMPPPTTPNLTLPFPYAWYSRRAFANKGINTYYLVEENDRMLNLRPNTTRCITWHKGEPMKVICKSDNGTNHMEFLLGDPLEHEKARLTLPMTEAAVYSAEIVSGEKYTLISLLATAGGTLDWIATGDTSP